MAAITIVIVIIIILFLIICLVKIDTKIDGGEYFTAYLDRKKVKVSPSQQYLVDHPIIRKLDTKEITDVILECCNTFKSNIAWKYGDKLLVYKEATAMRISDAQIDLEIMRSIFDISEGYSVCEANSNILYTWDSAIITYGSNILNYITTEGIRHDFKFSHSLMIKQMIARNPRIQAFVEFTYDRLYDKDVLNAYFNIHKQMIVVAKHLQSIVKSTSKYIVIIYKFIINNDGTLDSDCKLISKFENVEFIIQAYGNFDPYDENSNIQHKIIVPDSIDLFKMDEFLIFDSNEDIYAIQVEHSESKNGHKSNIIEAILRSVYRYVKNHSSYDIFDKYFDQLLDIKMSLYRLNKQYKIIKPSLDELKANPEKTLSGRLNKRYEVKLHNIEDEFKRITSHIETYKSKEKEIEIDINKTCNDFAHEYRKDISTYNYLLQNKDITLKDAIPPIQLTKYFIRSIGYYMDKGKFLKNRMVGKQSPLRISWDEFASKYF